MPRQGSLPRLPAEHYRGRAFVHWTFTVEHRATGWLTRDFHHIWSLVLLHASTRYSLVASTYVLMPDHVHLLWLGTSTTRSDQRIAAEALRRHLRPHIAPANWQHQVHDHVLHEDERARGAFGAIATYIMENPVRAALVTNWTDYSFLGCCVPGYPEFDPRMPDFWLRFWRCYNYLIETRTS